MKPRFAFAVLALGFVSCVLVYQIDDVGIWDPVELERAEAVRVGKSAPLGLAAYGSVALGFRLLGTTVMGGRLPLALWGCLGAVALFAMVATFKTTRAAAWSAIVLCTMPLYFVQARSLLGDMVMMASGGVALSGLAIAAFGHRVSVKWRTVACALGASGLLAGFFSRGGTLVGVAVPALAIGLVWALAKNRTARGGGAIGAACLALGSVAAVDGLLSTRGLQSLHHSFDFELAAVAHSLFPWSALLPFALGYLFEPRETRETPDEDVLEALLIVAAFVAYAAHALTKHDALAFPAPYALAGIIAIAMTREHAAARHWLALAILGGCFTFLLFRDYARLPEKTFAPFSLARVIPPESFRARSTFFFLTSAGLLATTLVALAIASLTNFGAKRNFGTIVLTGAALSALVLRFGHYQELGRHLSPKGAFDTYAKLHQPGEPLALLSVDPRASRYIKGNPAAELKSPTEALSWLSRGERTWLILRGSDLPPLNALYRAHTSRNIPILDGRSSENLLSSSTLTLSERNQNPLETFVLSTPPEISHPLDAKIGDAIEPLGWNAIDPQGNVTPSVKRGYRLRFYYRITTKVNGNLCTFIHVEHLPTRFSAEHRETDWARYPMRYWAAGDIIVDEFALSLPPHFQSGQYPLYVGLDAMPCTGDNRVPVTRGTHADHRLHAGLLEVRP